MKKALIIALILIVTGAVIFVAAGICWGFDFDFVKGEQLAQKSYSPTGTFAGININVLSENVSFKPSSDGTLKIETLERSDREYTVAISDGILLISSTETAGSIMHINLGLKQEKIDVFLPEKTYDELYVNCITGKVTVPSDFEFGSITVEGSTCDILCSANCKGALKLKCTTGDVKLANMSAASVSIEVTTGDIDLEKLQTNGDVSLILSTGEAKLTDVLCANLYSDGTTGDITLEETVASGKMRITRTTGDVVFKSSDAEKLKVKTSTGSITGSLKTEKIFRATSKTGECWVPTTSAGGLCELESTTGDIEVGLH